MLYVNGSPGPPPVRPLGLQAYHSSAYYGAIAVMRAACARSHGEGQWIDLSMQEATACGGRACRRWSTSSATNRAAPRHLALEPLFSGRQMPRRLHHALHARRLDLARRMGQVATARRGPRSTRMTAAMYRGLNAEHLFDVLDEWVKDYDRDELLERAQLCASPTRPCARPKRCSTMSSSRARIFRRSRASGAGPQVPLPRRAVSVQWHAVARYARPPLVGEHTGEILRDELAMAPKGWRRSPRKESSDMARCRSKACASSISPGSSPGRLRRESSPTTAPR